MYFHFCIEYHYFDKDKIVMRQFFFTDETVNNSEVHLKRMLRILEEFPQDPILSIYVIDDVWEYMAAIKVCKPC